MFEYTTTSLTYPTVSSTPNCALTRPHISSPTSSLSPPSNLLPSEQIASVPRLRVAGSERSTQTKRPKGATQSCSDAYKPLDTIPASWDIFAYNSLGELELGRTYSTEELERYLYRNPQHHVGETYNAKLGGLTLWVQRTPQDSSTLGYDHPPAGLLCRFQDCEHSNNVIKAGDIRVAFDENSKYIPNLDPKHNAGYVHLKCLEKKMSFPQLCIDLDIKPEDRVLPLEPAKKNPMIMRDRRELDHVQRIIDFCNKAGRAPLSYPDLGMLHEELEKNPPNISLPQIRGRWQRGGVRWDDEQKARTQVAKDLANIQRMAMARARRAEAAKMKKKRAHDDDDYEEESVGRDRSKSEVKPRRHQPKRRFRG
ncbi:hypothetical protein MMC31_006476 [Peltigera leucophlebia]|nr:hypothetical protein [Peltigera leucophlebia]